MKIAAGGCYPSNWPGPPRSWPPVEPPPEPDPESLDATVDWMTYSHHELYQMVHSGLDLTGAMAVSAQWARLGDELADIGFELGRIVDAAAASWEGEAADLARDTLAGLTHWATDAGTLATKAAGCVSIEVDNATNARDEMPAPPFDVVEPAPAVRAFTSGEFTDAATLTADPSGPVGTEKALHAQAARTMEKFQLSSREVYGTVPQFSPPQVGTRLFTGPVDPPPSQPEPRPHPPAPVPVPPRGPAPRGPAAGPATGPPGSPGSSEGRAPAPGRVATPAAPGSGAGTAEPAAPTRPAAASATPERPGRPNIGGMPMGGAGGARGAEDTERKSSYVKEDEDIWGMDEQRTAPPVIGVDRHRRA